MIRLSKTFQSLVVDYGDEKYFSTKMELENLKASYECTSPFNHKYMFGVTKCLGYKYFHINLSIHFTHECSCSVGKWSLK